MNRGVEDLKAPALAVLEGCSSLGGTFERGRFRVPALTRALLRGASLRCSAVGSSFAELSNSLKAATI
jgi:hypothetical protein